MKMKLIEQMVKGLFIGSIRAIKLNLGINGETLEPGGVNSGGVVPDGIIEAMIFNPMLVSGISMYFNAMPEQVAVNVIITVFGTFAMGFFGFPMIKDYLGIRFPSGNGFYKFEKIPGRCCG